MNSKNQRNNQKTLLEKMSLYVAKSPDKAVLLLILLSNIIFFAVGATIISQLAPSTLQNSGFWPSVFYTITMILDAGCISFVVEDVGQTGLTVIIVCLLIVLIGMITFTGAIIGYVTNYISSFIDSSNAGKRPLKISGHTIILNWNSRGAEIVNDLLFSEKPEDIVILVQEDKDDVQAELYNRISNSISTYNSEVTEQAHTIHSSFINQWLYIKRHKLRNNLSIIVREGDALSKTQLSEISIEKANTIIILGRDYQNSYSKYSSHQENDDKFSRGNSNIIKNLILVTEMTSDDASADDQKIIVEIEDQWTYDLVSKIIEHKERLEKCNIVPLPVNDILGKLMSQLAIMPQLNQVYGELFSNKGFLFTSEKLPDNYDADQTNRMFGEYLTKYKLALPLSVMETKEGTACFYLCKNLQDVNDKTPAPVSELKVKLNENYYLNRQNVIILGHNSGMLSLMSGFNAFRDEWNFESEEEILNIVIIDTEESLKKYNYYKDYPYVTQVVSADIFDKEKIYNTITGFSNTHSGEISVLILSDDQVPNEEIDERPLAYLIYIDDLLHKQKDIDPDFDPSQYEIIVEILNPQNYEAVRDYNSNHVVISNQYLSHMITQISEHAAIYEFYQDILTYDDPESVQFESKELYLKKAGDFFEELPPKCNAHSLVKAVFEAGPDENKAVLMGYIPHHEKEHVLFASNNCDLEVEIDEKDLLIMCSNH